MLLLAEKKIFKPTKNQICVYIMKCVLKGFFVLLLAEKKYDRNTRKKYEKLSVEILMNVWRQFQH